MFSFLCEIFIRNFITIIPRSIPKLINDVYTNSNPNIVIGDSHIYRGFINEKEFLNLGRRGIPIPVMKIILDNYYIKTDPDKIIIEAAPQLFSQVHQERGTLGFENYFTMINSPVRINLFDPGFSEYFTRINSLKDASNILNKNWEDDSKQTSQAWLSFDEEMRQHKIMTRINHHRPIMDSILTNKYKQLYIEIIENLLSKNAEICLLRTPVNEGYLNLSMQDNEYINANKFFKELAIKFNLKYVDFMDLDIEFTEDMFINQDHITPIASDVFSAHAKNKCFNNT